MVRFGGVAEANSPAFLAGLPVGFGGFCPPSFEDLGDAVPIFRRVEKRGIQGFDDAVAAAVDFGKNRQITDAHRFYHRQRRPFVVAGVKNKIPLGHDFPIILSALAPQEGDGGVRGKSGWKRIFGGAVAKELEFAVYFFLPECLEEFWKSFHSFLRIFQAPDKANDDAPLCQSRALFEMRFRRNFGRHGEVPNSIGPQIGILGLD